MRRNSDHPLCASLHGALVRYFEAPRGRPARNFQMPEIFFYRYSLANPTAQMPGLRSLCIFKDLIHPFANRFLG
jgi:hypothetical protein